MDGGATVQMVFAIALPNVLVYVVIERSWSRRMDELLTGVVNGSRMHKEHRRLKLGLSWMTYVGLATGSQTIFTIGYWLLSRNAADETAAKFAQLYAYFSGIGALAWFVWALFGTISVWRATRRASD